MKYSHFLQLLHIQKNITIQSKGLNYHLKLSGEWLNFCSVRYVRPRKYVNIIKTSYNLNWNKTYWRLELSLWESSFLWKNHIKILFWQNYWYKIIFSVYFWWLLEIREILQSCMHFEIYFKYNLFYSTGNTWPKFVQEILCIFCPSEVKRWMKNDSNFVDSKFEALKKGP